MEVLEALHVPVVHWEDILMSQSPRCAQIAVLESIRITMGKNLVNLVRTVRIHSLKEVKFAIIVIQGKVLFTTHWLMELLPVQTVIKGNIRVKKGSLNAIRVLQDGIQTVWVLRFVENVRLATFRMKLANLCVFSVTKVHIQHQLVIPTALSAPSESLLSPEGRTFVQVVRLEGMRIRREELCAHFVIQELTLMKLENQFAKTVL